MHCKSTILQYERKINKLKKRETNTLRKKRLPSKSGEISKKIFCSQNHGDKKLFSTAISQYEYRGGHLM